MEELTYYNQKANEGPLTYAKQYLPPGRQTLISWADLLKPFNAIGTRATRESFVRWGYTSWWHLVTGGLEILSAFLIALPVGRDAGLVLGKTIIAAALLTVLRHREYSDLTPPSVFLALIALAAFSS
jgi:DoxX-like family